MRRFKLIYALIIFFSLYGCGPTFIPFEKFDPQLRWEVIESPHFQVYYHQNEQEIALKASQIAEEVHQSLSQRFQWTPGSKTDLIISDYLDAVFGQATPFPNNIITITPTQPAGGLGIQPIRYEDWLRVVITHEYTHILHLDSVGGFPLLMRYFFGRNPVPLFSIPNIWQPLWMIEGLAVYMETTEGTSDRMDNSFTEMILRMAVLDHQLDSIDQASRALTIWPDGFLPYLYGAKFYQFIAKKYGPEKLTEISRRYSRNTLPFRVEKTAEEVLERDYLDLWAEWRTGLNVRYSTAAKKVRDLGLTSVRLLTDRGNEILGGRYSPDGKNILYTEHSPDHYPSFHVVDREGKNDRVLSRRNTGFDAAWSPDGQKIIYSQLEVYQNFSFFSDLYSRDLSKKETKRLTNGLRGKEVDYSPQGHFLVFVQEELGKNRLALWSFEKSAVIGMTPFSDSFLISSPRWLNDEEKIVFSGWEKGKQNIYLFDRKTREKEQLTDDSFQNLTPVPGTTDDQILFVSDRNGIYNLHGYDLKTKEIRQLTNVLGGVFLPSVSPGRKEILFSTYGAKGFDLAVMESKFFFTGKQEKEDLIKERPGQDHTKKIQVPETFKSVPYTPWKTLFPQFWVPWGGIDEAGAQLGAWTTGIDVLRQHRYLVVGLYGLESKRFSYLLDYMNDQFYSTLDLGYSDTPKYYANLLVNSTGQRNSYWERQQIFKANFLFPFLRFHSKQVLKIGFERKGFSPLSSPFGFLPPQTGTLSTIKGGYIYDSSEEYPLSISHEEGRTVQLLIEDSDKKLGSDFNLVKYIANIREYHALFVPHGVLAGQITGGIGQGELIAQRAFQLGGPLVIDQPFLEQDDFFLRGYPSHQMIGQNMIVANLEYRFPFPLVEKGSGTIPYFVKRLHAGLFVDYGAAWDQTPSIQDFKTGVGAEFKVDFNLFYHLPVRGRLGTALGLNSSGEKQIYFSMGNSF